MTPEEMDRLEAVARAATPGPWSNVGLTEIMDVVVGKNGENLTHDDGGYFLNAADAAFISEFNPATALALLGELRAARGALKEAKTTLGWISAGAGADGDPYFALNGISVLAEKAYQAIDAALGGAP